MKGIIQACGSGTRLHPLTLVMSKKILIISTPHDLPNFEKLSGDYIFCGNGMSKLLEENADVEGGVVFAYYALGKKWLWGLSPEAC